MCSHTKSHVARSSDGKNFLLTLPNFLNEGIINEEFFIWDEHNFENSNNTPIFNCLMYIKYNFSENHLNALWKLMYQLKI